MAKALSHSDTRPTRRLVCGAAMALVVVNRWGGASASEDAGVTDWVVVDHARVRLIDAGALPGNPALRLAGIEMELDPFYLTYWRSPGEAGVAPTTDFKGSKNLRSATISFPAPRRFSEGGLEAIGYKGGILLPLVVTARDPAKPVTLAMALSFAICERQCIPVQAALTLALGGTGQSPEAERVRGALSRVPAQATVGQAGPLSVAAVQGQSGADELAVLVKTTGSDVPMLFAEAPDPWFVQAGEGLWLSDGTLKYRVKVLSKPAEPAELPLRLTLVGVEAAVEVPVTLDAPPPKP